MALGKFQSDSSHAAINKVQHTMSDINVTPMVDVMLVLLVIFMITAPLLNHAVLLELPKANSSLAPKNNLTLTLILDAQGQIYWEKDKINFDSLADRFKAELKKTPKIELQLRADKSTRYEMIAQVMALAQTNGIHKIGFVTEFVAEAASPPFIPK